MGISGLLRRYGGNILVSQVPKNRNSLRSMSMDCVCRAKSGVASNSTPSCLTKWYGERFRLPIWVSADTSAKLPAQVDR